MKMQFKCVECGDYYPIPKDPKTDQIRYTCSCGGVLDIEYDYDMDTIDRPTFLSRPIGVWRYRELLPVSKRVSFNEGGTGLYKCPTLAKKLGLQKLYVKNEGENPTGSFKDRGMTVGVSRALDLGFEVVGCASTGNTSASLAAYSARASIKAVVFIPVGNIAWGKLAQALIHNSVVISLRGNFDEAMEIAIKLANQGHLYLLNSINPFRLEGQRTLGYEILDQLHSQKFEAPDRIFIPVGNAGNISAVWKAMQEYHRFGWLNTPPKMCGVQAEGAAPLTRMYEEHTETLTPVENPETVATAIRIGNPVSWQKALNAARQSGGLITSVSDEDILDAQKLLASTEGIFVEPASAASIAGLKQKLEQGLISSDERIVCITTGNGLKDPNVAVDRNKHLIREVNTNEEEILAVIKEKILTE
jgi:threonine synthase